LFLVICQCRWRLRTEKYVFHRETCNECCYPLYKFLYELRIVRLKQLLTITLYIYTYTFINYLWIAHRRLSRQGNPRDLFTFNTKHACTTSPYSCMY
jgi:hypothetical protein